MQAHEETENKTHRNFEPPGVQYHNTEESHQQGNNEINNREPVDIVFRDIVVPSSEVRYGGKGEPHLWREAVQLMKAPINVYPSSKLPQLLLHLSNNFLKASPYAKESCLSNLSLATTSHSIVTLSKATILNIYG